MTKTLNRSLRRTFRSPHPATFLIDFPFFVRRSSVTIIDYAVVGVCLQGRIGALGSSTFTPQQDDMHAEVKRETLQQAKHGICLQLYHLALEHGLDWDVVRKLFNVPRESRRDFWKRWSAT